MGIWGLLWATFLTPSLLCDLTCESGAWFLGRKNKADGVNVKGGV